MAPEMADMVLEAKIGYAYVKRLPSDRQGRWSHCSIGRACDMDRLLRALIGILSLPLVAAFVVQAFQTLAESADSWLRTPFSLGFTVSFVVFLIPLVWFRFSQTFEHELGHLLFVLLFLRRPTEFLVSPGPGHVEFNYRQGCLAGTLNTITALGAYTVPIFMIPFLLAKLVFPGLGSALDFLIGFAFAFYVLRVVLHMRPNYHGEEKSDFQKVGFIFSYAAIFLFNSILAVAVIAFIIGDWPLFRDYLADAVTLTQQYYMATASWLRDLWVQTVGSL